MERVRSNRIAAASLLQQGTKGASIRFREQGRGKVYVHWKEFHFEEVRMVQKSGNKRKSRLLACCVQNPGLLVSSLQHPSFVLSFVLVRTQRFSRIKKELYWMFH